VSHIRTGPLSPKETRAVPVRARGCCLRQGFPPRAGAACRESATRDVGSGNALHRRLPVRPRMQIRLGAERDNWMHLRCFLRRHLLCLPLGKRMTWLQMYTRYTRGSKGWYRTTHAAVPPNGGFRFAATASATTADEYRRWLGPEATEKACKTPGSSHQLLIGSGVQPA